MKVVIISCMILVLSSIVACKSKNESCKYNLDRITNERIDDPQNVYKSVVEKDRLYIKNITNNNTYDMHLAFTKTDWSSSGNYVAVNMFSSYIRVYKREEFILCIEKNICEKYDVEIYIGELGQGIFTIDWFADAVILYEVSRGEILQYAIYDVKKRKNYYIAEEMVSFDRMKSLRMQIPSEIVSMIVSKSGLKEIEPGYFNLDKQDAEKRP